MQLIGDMGEADRELVVGRKHGRSSLEAPLVKGEWMKVFLTTLRPLRELRRDICALQPG